MNKNLACSTSCERKTPTIEQLNRDQLKGLSTWSKLQTLFWKASLFWGSNRSAALNSRLFHHVCLCTSENRLQCSACFCPRTLLVFTYIHFTEHEFTRDTPLCSPLLRIGICFGGFFLPLNLTRTHQDVRRLEHGPVFFSRFRHFIPSFAARAHGRLCLLSEYLNGTT